MKHELKIWPKFFPEVMAGRKTFEIRKNDRGFQVGDTLHLAEWEPQTKKYTGKYILVRVSSCHDLTDIPGFELVGGNWVVMSIQVID